MIAKEYLSQIEKQSVIINNLDKEIERLLKDATAVSSPDYSAERSRCTRVSGCTEQYEMVESAVDLIRKLFKSREKANKFRFKIIGEIHQLDNANYIKLLYKRYAEYKKFNAIAREMNYDEDWAICIRFGKSFPSGDYVTAIYQRMLSGVNRWTFTVPDQAISMRIGIIQHGPYGSTVGDTITVEWIKLELGSVATPFVPPNPATELLKCRRFFYRIGRNIPFFNPGNGIVINKDPSTHEVIGEGYLYLPTSMRVAPTIVSTPMMSFCNNEAYVPKSFTASFDSAHAIVSWTSVTVIKNYPGLTIHDPCFLHLRDDVSIDFSADL